MHKFADRKKTFGQHHPNALRVVLSLMAVCVLSVGTTACGESTKTSTTSDKPAAASASDNVVKVKLGENGGKYFIKLDKSTVPAGETTFKIDNIGTMHHEMAIYKTDVPAGELPLNDEGKAELDEANVIGEAVYATPLRGDADHRIRDGRGVDYTIDLKPGKYVLLCNLAGHYSAGQYIEFTVEGDAGNDGDTGSDEGADESTSTDESDDEAATATGTPVKVKLGENGGKYFIKLDKSTVPAGETTFKIDNIGTMHHEMAIYKTDVPAGKLPLNDEGKADLDEANVVGEAIYTTPPRGDADHRIRDGRGVDYTIDLKPGKYVLLCNLAGHYSAGQYIEFTVK